MKTKVAVEGAEFFARHGFYDEEQKAGNVFIVDAEVTFESVDMGSDDLNLTVNYEQLYDICKEEMKNTHRLIETVAFNILNKMKIYFPEISGARVKIQKIAPQLGGKVAKSVIEMEM